MSNGDHAFHGAVGRIDGVFIEVDFVFSEGEAAEEGGGGDHFHEWAGRMGVDGGEGDVGCGCFELMQHTDFGCY